MKKPKTLREMAHQYSDGSKWTMRDGIVMAILKAYEAGYRRAHRDLLDNGLMTVPRSAFEPRINPTGKLYRAAQRAAKKRGKVGYITDSQISTLDVRHKRGSK